MSARQLIRVIDKLEDSGELSVRRSEGRLPNHYSLPLMNSDKMSPLKKTPTVTKSRVNSDISDSNSDITTSHDPSVRSVSNNGHLPERANGYKKTKTLKHQISEFEDPETLDPDHAFRDYLRSMFPTVPIPEFYKKWYLSRFRQGGIKGHLGRSAPIEHYHADIEFFFGICAENEERKNGNGNGHEQPRPRTPTIREKMGIVL